MNAKRPFRSIFAVLGVGTMLALGGCGSPPEAEETTLEQLLDRRAPDIEEAKQMIAAGQLFAARDALQRLREREPENAETAMLLGDVLLRLHEPQRAVEHYQAATAKPELRVLALQGAGLALLQLGHFEEAEISLGEAVATDASLWRAQNGLGRIYDEQRKWADAENAYRQAITANPNSALLFNNFGMSYLLQHRFDEAMAQFQKSIALDPNQTAARANMRMAYALQGKYIEALAGVPQEEMPDALNNVGYAATLRGDYEAARAYFARALETSPAFHKKASANMQQLEGIVDIANAAAP